MMQPSLKIMVKSEINMLKKINFRYYNFILIFLVTALLCLGVYVINDVNDEYTVKQAVGVGLSVVIMIVLSLIDYHFIAKFYSIRQNCFRD